MGYRWSEVRILSPRPRHRRCRTSPGMREGWNSGQRAHDMPLMSGVVRPTFLLVIGQRARRATMPGWQYARLAHMSSVPEVTTRWRIIIADDESLIRLDLREMLT